LKGINEAENIMTCSVVEIYRCFRDLIVSIFRVDAEEHPPKRWQIFTKFGGTPHKRATLVFLSGRN
jgi:hypothetical protein